jgi:hypothetical protein
VDLPGIDALRVTTLRLLVAKRIGGSVGIFGANGSAGAREFEAGTEQSELIEFECEEGSAARIGARVSGCIRPVT